MVMVPRNKNTLRLRHISLVGFRIGLRNHSFPLTRKKKKDDGA